MAGEVLYGADFGSIQGFIFEVPRLRQMVGGSAIVRELTERVPREILATQLGDDAAKKALVYAGGGSMTLVLPSEDAAAQFDAALRGACQRRLGADRFNSAWVATDSSFATSWTDLGDELRRARAARSGWWDPLSSPIATSCEECGTRTAVRPVGIAADGLCPLCREREAAADTRGVLDELSQWGASALSLKVTNDFERIAKDSASGMLSLVVMDGNDIGRLVSGAVESAGPGGRAALSEIAEKLRSVFGTAVARGLEQTCGDSRHCRPILVGGDDIAVVLPAEQGIPFALKAIAAVEAAGAVGGRSKLTASAGVCVFKYNYPFHAARTIAEGALESAKRAARPSGASAIDWHIVQGGSAADLPSARKGEFTSTLGGATRYLTGRPYVLATGSDTLARLGKVVGAMAGLGATRKQEVRAMSLDPSHEAVRREDFRARLKRDERQSFEELVRAASGGESLFARGDDGSFTVVLDAMELMGLDAASAADWGWSS